MLDLFRSKKDKKGIWSLTWVDVGLIWYSRLNESIGMEAVCEMNEAAWWRSVSSSDKISDGLCISTWSQMVGRTFCSECPIAMGELNSGISAGRIVIRFSAFGRVKRSRVHIIEGGGCCWLLFGSPFVWSLGPPFAWSFVCTVWPASSWSALCSALAKRFTG